MTFIRYPHMASNITPNAKAALNAVPHNVRLEAPTSSIALDVPSKTWIVEQIAF